MLTKKNRSAASVASPPTSPSPSVASRKFSLPALPRRVKRHQSTSSNSSILRCTSPKATVVEISASLLIFSFSFASVYAAPAPGPAPPMEMNDVGKGAMDDVQVPTAVVGGGAQRAVSINGAMPGFRPFTRDGGFDVNSYRYLIKVKRSPWLDYSRAFASPRLSPYFLSALPKRSPYATYAHYLNADNSAAVVGPVPSSSSSEGHVSGGWQPLSINLFDDNEPQPGAARLEWNFNRL